MHLTHSVKVKNLWIVYGVWIKNRYLHGSSGAAEFDKSKFGIAYQYTYVIDKCGSIITFE